MPEHYGKLFEIEAPTDRVDMTADRRFSGASGGAPTHHLRTHSCSVLHVAARRHVEL